MTIAFNEEINAAELNALLATVGWDVEHLNLIEETLDVSWGWITLRDDAQKLIGFVQLIAADDGHVGLYKFLVHREVQGQGIGTQLFKSLLTMLEKEHMNLLPMGGEDDAFYDYFELGQNRKRTPMFLGN